MTIATHPPETDLIVPLPAAGESWDPWTIHTHYFGFSVPEAELGAFLYVRYMPAFPLCQGGVGVFQGTDNLEPGDMAFLDYRLTMPWPEIEGNTITTATGCGSSSSSSAAARGSRSRARGCRSTSCRRRSPRCSYAAT